MKSKALNSLKAAQRLVEARETYGYNSSIHCSYYALLQYMKYKLATFKKNPLPYEKQDKKDESSHDYLLKEIKNRINNPIKERKFSERFFSNFGTFMYLSLRRPLSAKEKSRLFHP